MEAGPVVRVISYGGHAEVRQHPFEHVQSPSREGSSPGFLDRTVMVIADEDVGISRSHQSQCVQDLPSPRVAIVAFSRNVADHGATGARTSTPCGRHVPPPLIPTPEPRLVTSTPLSRGDSSQRLFARVFPKVPSTTPSSVSSHATTVSGPFAERTFPVRTIAGIPKPVSMGWEGISEQRSVIATALSPLLRGCDVGAIR